MQLISPKILETTESNKVPIHLESFVSYLLPATVFAHLGLATVTLISFPQKLKTGTRYFPVDFVQTSRHGFLTSHSLNYRIELLKAEWSFLW